MKPFGVLPLKRLNVPKTLLSKISFSSSDKRNLVTLGIILITLSFLIGCASQKGRVSETDYLSLLPEDAEIYLRFPVQENQEVASNLISSLVPEMEEKDMDNLKKRFDNIYAAVKNSELSAIATGSFPKAGLGFVLTEKNGWTKVKDEAVPVTKEYYQYQNLPFQIAFPNSSTMMTSPQVNELLASYEQASSLDYYPQINPLAQFSSEYEDMFLGSSGSVDSQSYEFNNQTIDFYVSDVISVVIPLLKRTLPISLPLTDLYGRFTPVSNDDLQVSADNTTSEGKLYSFTGYLGLSDSRAMLPTLAALKIVFRTLGFNVEYEALGEDTIKISGLTVSEQQIVSLLNKSLK